MIRTTLCMLILALAAAPAGFSQRLEAEFIGITAGRPTSIAFAPGVTDRMYVTEKTGRIWIVKDGTYQAPPFMDLRPIVNADGEGGLLGMVFDPQFAANGRFYISYNGGLGQGESLISRFTVQAGSIDFGDPNSEQILFGPVAQTTGRHKGGDLMFGPDGDLYFALGDGGVPSTAQDLSSPKGKVHRIDPNLPFPHAPADNPFVGTPGAVPTIWARGFRNPWRFDVDPATGDVYVGDVGEGTWEEITRLVSQQAGGGGENAGWPCLEGTSCFAGGANCACTNPTFTAPIALLSHSNPDNACSIIAGGVYRGSRIPSLAGQLVFTDFCSGSYYSLEDPAGPSPTIVDVSADIDNGGNLIRFVATWGRDQEGELYFAEHYGSNIWKIAPRGGFDAYCSAQPNSTGSAAELTASGSASIAAGSLTLSLTDLPANALGYFLVSRQRAFAPGFGGSQGNLCLDQPIARWSNFVLNSGPMGEAALTTDLTNLPPTVSPEAGLTLNFQYWTRDANPGPTSNTSNGLAVTFLP